MPRPYELFLLAASDSVMSETIGLAETLRDRGHRVGLAVGSQNPTYSGGLRGARDGTNRLGLGQASYRDRRQ